MYCTKCGSALYEGQKFCTKCGTRVRTEPPKYRPLPIPQNDHPRKYAAAQKESHSLKILGIIAGVLLGVFIAVLLVFLIIVFPLSRKMTATQSSSSTTTNTSEAAGTEPSVCAIDEGTYTQYSPSDSVQRNPETTVPTEKSVQHIFTGYVYGTTSLKIRRGPSVGYDEVGRLSQYEAVEIYEVQKTEAGRWGRIDRGWVSMEYITMDSSVVRQAFNDQHTDNFDVGYVQAEGGLRVRNGPGLNYSEVSRLPNGQQVAIFEYQNVAGTTWGRIDRGWISMDYITSELPSGTCGVIDIPDSVLSRFEGKWGDRVSQRCFAEICFGLTAFTIEIRWASSASETTVWNFTGIYDSNSDSLKYSNGKCIERAYHDDGGITEKVRYANGSGRFYISNGEMYWEDYTEGAGSRCIFEKQQ